MKNFFSEAYQITETLYESGNSLIYRVLRQTDGQSVILKLLQDTYPSPERIAQFKREYELTHNLHHPGIIDAYHIETLNNRWCISLEDFGGQNLHQLNLAPLSPTDFLPLAIEIVEILGYLHQNHIIHKDINPSNILFNPTTQTIKLIDFGLSTVLSQEISTFRNPNLLEGTLAYISPEQTGRMNRSVDYRTDFYSLGITFYELLTGSLPFLAQDPLELVHSHLAKPPTPPYQINSKIPQALSQIILKLIAKNAEDRYKSASGLKADLQQCWDSLQRKGKIALFPLGIQDISERLQIPQKLYGREQEVATLIEAFKSVTYPPDDPEFNSTKITLVSGYSGIGKTALVQEIYKPITRGKGYFIAGKFDQFHRNIPYASLIQAFRSLIKQFLTETDSQIAQWREKLQKALGVNAPVIIEVIPELATILGTQSPIPELSPVEAQNRFNLAFQNFIKVFTQPEHPLAIFLDDLQWADSASLQLIELIMTAPESQCLFLIGAYRDNEVSATHPLMLTVEAIKKTQARVLEISLKPLALSDVTQLLADTLYQRPQQVQPLAELVESKTGGNPFFLTEFLKTLYGEGWLRFDYNGRSWQWNIQQIQGQPIADNVVDLMAAKLHKLPPETQTILELAACIGNQFDLITLAIIAETSARETALTLKPALNEGFILPLSDDYKLIELDVEGLEERISVEYKFAHDRIQQAAYSFIPDTHKKAVYLQIGRLLLKKISIDEQEEKIFDIVNKFNFSRDLIEDLEEQNKIAQLNLIAGKKAKKSAAYQPAYTYFQAGIDLLINQGWKTQYQLAVALHNEAAEAAYLCGDFDKMQRLIDLIKQEAIDLIDRVKAYEVLLLAYNAQNQLPKALTTALEVLKLLGVDVTERPSDEDVMQVLQETQELLDQRSNENLLTLPAMTDPYKLAAMKIIAMSYNASYTIQGLFALIVCKQINLSILYGYAPLSATAFAFYGFLLCRSGQLERGYQYGQLALQFISRLTDKEIQARVWVWVYYFTTHFKEHIKTSLPIFIKGYKAGLESGSFDSAASNLTSYTVNAYLCGRNLEILEKEANDYSALMHQIKQYSHLNWHESFRQAIINLRGNYDKPWELKGEAFNEEIMMPLRLQSGDVAALCNMYVNKLILAYQFSEFQDALNTTADLDQYAIYAMGTPAYPTIYLYHSLTHLAIYPDSPESEQQRILEKVTANQETMQLWAQQAPMNYLHKYYLVEAERARVLNNDADARDYYDRAITLAKEHEYLNEEALAYELAARFYIGRNIPHLARFYLKEAHYAYQRWGATAKVKHLETHYPELIELRTSTRSTIATTSISGSSSGETLDIATVLKASQAISSEIQLNKLLSQLLNLAIENAGAQKGVLILSDNNQLKIEAAKLPNGEVQILESLPLESGNFVPPAIINYVARTQENVILANATEEGIFTTDPYILQQQTQSLLCAAIVNQGKLIGILYLENNLATGAFTQERIELLQVISAQAAISLENAQLYRTLEDKVIERTAQLAEANEEISALNELLKSDNLRMSAELDVTRQLQQKMLPRTEELQGIPGLEIAGFMEPADEIGGDYYGNYSGGGDMMLS